jgi:hypothetical protein
MQSTTETQYNDLTSFLLNVVKPRPGLVLHEAKISNLSLFITGYMVGYGIAGKKQDRYFGENGFIDWFCRKYNVDEPCYTMMPFLNIANDDEKKALEIYFGYLQEYQDYMNK